MHVGGGVTAPEILNRVEIRYPDALREKRRQAALIVVEGVVTARGEVRELHAIRGANDPLTSYIIVAIDQWKFKPAMREGHPVSVEVLVGIPSEEPVLREVR